MWWRLLRGRSPSPISRKVVEPRETSTTDLITNPVTNFSATEICSPPEYATTTDEITVRTARRGSRSSSVQPAHGDDTLFAQVNPDRRCQRSSSVPPRNSQVVRNFTSDTLHFRNPYENEAPTITLYTDASCIGQYAAGMGVFFGIGHPLNVSRPCGPPFNSGYAEIMAATVGLQTLREWTQYNSENVKVCSDYLPMIRSLLFPSPNERFALEISILREVAQRFPRGVLFQHVYGHTGDFGNEEADALARQAVGRGRSRSRSRSRSRTRDRSRSQSRSRESTRNENNDGPSWHNREQLPDGGRVVYVPPLNPIRSRTLSDYNETAEDDDVSGYGAMNSIAQASEFSRAGRSRSTRMTVNSLMHP